MTPKNVEWVLTKMLTIGPFTEVQRVYSGVKQRVGGNNVCPDELHDDSDGQRYKGQSPIIIRRRLGKIYWRGQRSWGIVRSRCRNGADCA